MMNAAHLPTSLSDNPNDLLFSVLENTEAGVTVVDASGRAVYMNSSARALLRSPAGILPDWIALRLPAVIEGLQRSPRRAHGGPTQVIERWDHDELVLRVRARLLDRFTGLVVLELTVAHSGSSREVAEHLARALQLTITDARLLALLWRGMSNDEIAQLLRVRVGTVKSRLFRLYQKLGVKRRPAAVLRAAEVLNA